ncbi:pyridoxamine 5'-phosphate oxidase [Taibaiella soli]|uniref:Pyridoxine/pyridoxamine 5'-phosphate oxidase n=1 Tax=Taibaiella soli TaxID=1649169 RepID=A0A2W2AII8_9BACT|nr:pyridoxamine 5'-phosphate oxidase [Taibaiella soli]PZF72050.1 pyridoxamine 5'-phosphate oxidase [Taibaiella soli]
MTTQSHIADIRKDYQLASLDESVTGNDPLAFFQKWFSEAENAGADEVNAMTLATVDVENRPHARIVLLKGLDSEGFTFFTNYDSDKGHHLAQNPNAALVFFWKELERQVRVEGKVTRVTPAESDQYFHSRPAGSRLGAWASPQSHIISDRSVLEQNVLSFQQKFPGSDIPRPENWGGYRLIPDYLEFWQGRSSRLHDRIVFKKQSSGNWEKYRLAP